jgi:hypothetical protein
MKHIHFVSRAESCLLPAFVVVLYCYSGSCRLLLPPSGRKGVSALLSISSPPSQKARGTDRNDPDQVQRGPDFAKRGRNSPPREKRHCKNLSPVSADSSSANNCGRTLVAGWLRGCCACGRARRLPYRAGRLFPIPHVAIRVRWTARAVGPTSPADGRPQTFPHFITTTRRNCPSDAPIAAPNKPALSTTEREDSTPFSIPSSAYSRHSLALVAVAARLQHLYSIQNPAEPPPCDSKCFLSALCGSSNGIVYRPNRLSQGSSRTRRYHAR